MTARVRALLSVFIWSAIGVLSYLLGVGTELGQQVEEQVLYAARFSTTPPPPLSLVSPLTIAVAVASVGIIAAIAHGWRRALGVAVLAIGGIAASQVLKALLPRPQHLWFDASNTFPSGHMAAFTVVVAALIWAVPTRFRRVTALGGAVLLSIVSWQLLAYRWHRPSDVVGAIALGVAIFAFGAALRPQAEKEPRKRTRLLFMSACVAFLAACVALAIAVAADSGSTLLLAAQLASFGVAAFAARSLERLASSA